METLDKWAERIYAENDFGRGIATSIAGIIGLINYLITRDWVIAVFSLIIIFPMVRIISTALNESAKRKFSKKMQHIEIEETFKKLSDAEKEVVKAFVDAGGTALTFSQINNLNLSNAAIESLIQRELLWTSVTADLMTETFALNTQLFDVAKTIRK